MTFEEELAVVHAFVAEQLAEFCDLDEARAPTHSELVGSVRAKFRTIGGSLSRGTPTSWADLLDGCRVWLGTTWDEPVYKRGYGAHRMLACAVELGWVDATWCSRPSRWDSVDPWPVPTTSAPPTLRQPESWLTTIEFPIHEYMADILAVRGGLGKALVDALSSGPVVLSGASLRIVPPRDVFTVPVADVDACVEAVSVATVGGALAPKGSPIQCFVGPYREGKEQRRLDSVWAVIDRAREVRSKAVA